jgi:hypothetical protein
LSGERTDSQDSERNSGFKTNKNYYVLWGEVWKIGPHSTIQIGSKLNITGASFFSHCNSGQYGATRKCGSGCAKENAGFWPCLPPYGFRIA